MQTVAIPKIQLDKEVLSLSLSNTNLSSWISKYQAIPFKQDETTLHIAIVLTDTIPLEKIPITFTTKEVLFYEITKSEFEKYSYIIETNRSIQYIASKVKDDIHSRTINKRNNTKTHTLGLLETIFEHAIKNRASDIHFESLGEYYHIRIRVDGVLMLLFEFESVVAQALISKIKLLANLDVATKKPQDGSFAYTILSQNYSLRISTITTYLNESVVIRILDGAIQGIRLENLGFDRDQLTLIKNTLQAKSGLILVTGATGSGKSTSLYSMLTHINSVEQKIITIEDPVEYSLPLVEQIEVNEYNNQTFESILRNILRHDPDILMIGEIRDSASLRLALQAAMTGHLVLSTLHTNDALSTITRLKDMGIEEYLITSTLKLIISQRLVRKLCEECKTEYTLPQSIANKIEPHINSHTKFYKPNGCERCNYSGYKGRVVISEVAPFDNNLASNYLHEDSFETLFDDGIKKSAKGVVYIHDIL